MNEQEQEAKEQISKMAKESAARLLQSYGSNFLQVVDKNGDPLPQPEVTYTSTGHQGAYGTPQKEWNKYMQCTQSTDSNVKPPSVQSLLLELSEKTCKLGAANKEIEELKSKLRDYQDQYANSFSYTDMNKLQSEIDELKERNTELLRNNNRLTVDYNALLNKGGLEYMENQKKHLLERLRVIQAENHELKNRVHEIDSDVIRDLKDELFTLRNDYAVDMHRKDKEIQELKDRLSWVKNPWKDCLLERLYCSHILKEEHQEDPVKAINALCAWESEVGAYFEREKTLPRKIRRLWHHVYSWLCNTSNSIPF